MEEQRTGNYDWIKLFRDSQTDLYSPDIADFTGPIEVRAGLNGLRGTYATRDVKAGELLVSSYPYALGRYDAEGQIKLSRNRCEDAAQAYILLYAEGQEDTRHRSADHLYSGNEMFG